MSKNKNEYVGFRIDPELVELLKVKARQEDRTIGGMLNHILRVALQDERERQQRKGARR